jgi:translation initiation factor 2B subunit (eIF-2B alpha/beta/delta family)
MARGALRLLLGLEFPRRREEAEDLAGLLMMMRPAMVAITVAMRRYLALSGKRDAAAAAAPSGSGPHPARQVLDELDRESRRSVEAAAEAARRALGARGRRRGGGASSADEATDSARPTAHVVVFSRSSTLVSVLEALGSDYGLRVTCSRSAPGGEGELMAQDVQGALGGFGTGGGGGEGQGPSVRVEDDAALLDPAWWLRNPVQLVLVGADCVMGGAAGAVYNKAGTRALAEAAGACRVPVICCGDAFKAWDDAFPPPLEEIFEAVPRELLAEVVA